jgi:hypothetical protein
VGQDSSPYGSRIEKPDRGRIVTSHSCQYVVAKHLLTCSYLRRSLSNILVGECTYFRSDAVECRACGVGSRFALCLLRVVLPYPRAYGTALNDNPRPRNSSFATYD